MMEMTISNLHHKGPSLEPSKSIFTPSGSYYGNESEYLWSVFMVTKPGRVVTYNEEHPIKSQDHVTN